MGVNYIDRFKDNIDNLNTFYLKTIHHEFSHILHQTYEYPSSFQLITPGYLADKWSNPEFGEDYLQRGFIMDVAFWSRSWILCAIIWKRHGILI